MARITSLPSPEIIRGFKGLIDFVEWRGIFYVRKWPVTPRSSLSSDHFVRAKLFGQIVRAYSEIAAEVIAFYREDAADQPRTARDLHVSAVLGHLHEVNMPDFLDLLERAVVALEIIDDFADPDNLLFGYEDRLFEDVEVTSTNGTTNADSTPVPPGEVHIVTHITARHNDPVARNLWIYFYDGAALNDLASLLPAPQNVTLDRQGLFILKEADYLRCRVIALGAGKDAILRINGYKMKV